MANFKVGDRVRINVGLYEGFTGTIKNMAGGAFIVNIDEAFGGDYLYSSDNLELIEMPKFVEVKTKTVKKYAVVGVNGNSKDLGNLYYSEKEVEHFNSVGGHGWKYHIVPTLFTEEEVPVKTETRYTFICKDHVGDYFGTTCKYKNLADAKEHTSGEAIQQIDSSAEEFEIE